MVRLNSLILMLLFAGTACREAETHDVNQDSGPDLKDAVIEDNSPLPDIEVDTIPDARIPPPMTWVEGPDLAQARTHHTATLLADGRLLVAGGLDRFNPVRSAEIYDPDSGSWSAVDEMQKPHLFHSAHLLADGRVFIVGGNWKGDGMDGMVGTGTEFFDPEAPAGTQWTKGPSMSVDRRAHCAVALSDGRILVAGGFDNLNDHTSIEIFDSATNSWKSSTALDEPRNQCAATLLASNKVLISGGGDSSKDESSLVMFDPATSAVTKLAGKLEKGRRGHAAIRLHDGRVLIVGGGCVVPPNDCEIINAEIYDPITDTVAGVGAPGLRGIGMTSTLLGGGEVLISGGRNTETKASLYDPSTSSWTPLPPIPRPHYNHTATRLLDNRVILVGGTLYGDIAVDIIQ